MHPKDADGMANSVDPDQTASSEAVWSWSALFAETYLSQYIEFVRYMYFKITVISHEASYLRRSYVVYMPFSSISLWFCFFTN